MSDRIDQIDTSVLLFDLHRVERNVAAMAGVARKAGVALRQNANLFGMAFGIRADRVDHEIAIQARGCVR